MKIKIKNVEKIYPKFRLTIPEFNIEEGETIKLYGNNGAGKTTFLRLILDLIDKEKGTIYINNKSNNTFSNWKKKTASFLDESFLIQYLKVKEYFEFLADVYKVSKKTTSEISLLAQNFLDIEPILDVKINSLSTGNKVKVGILGTLLVDANLLIFDEPTANLDPKSRSSFISLIKKYRQENTCTIIISSHDLNTTYSIDGRNIILDIGEIAYNELDSSSSRKDIENLLLT